MNNFPNSNNLYGYGFQQSSQQLNYPPPFMNSQPVGYDNTNRQFSAPPPPPPPENQNQGSSADSMQQQNMNMNRGRQQGNFNQGFNNNRGQQNSNNNNNSNRQQSARGGRRNLRGSAQFPGDNIHSQNASSMNSNFNDPKPNQMQGNFSNIRGQQKNNKNNNNNRNTGNWNRNKNNNQGQNSSEMNSNANIKFAHDVSQQPSQPISLSPNVPGTSTNVNNFEDEFRKWEEQFEKWQHEMRDHPDKEQYDKYKEQFMQYREALSTRLQKLKEKSISNPPMTDEQIKFSTEWTAGDPNKGSTSTAEPAGSSKTVYNPATSSTQLPPAFVSNSDLPASSILFGCSTSTVTSTKEIPQLSFAHDKFDEENIVSFEHAVMDPNYSNFNKNSFKSSEAFIPGLETFKEPPKEMLRNKQDDDVLIIPPNQTTELRKSPLVALPMPELPSFSRTKFRSMTLIDEILEEPGRSTRDKKVLIIIRGAPGSGKHYLADLIYKKEAEEYRNDRCKILSIRKFIVNHIYDPRKADEYDMQQLNECRDMMQEGYNNFVIVVLNGCGIKHFNKIAHMAFSIGKFECYSIEIHQKSEVCHKYDTYNRSIIDIKEANEYLVRFSTPIRIKLLDPSSLYFPKLKPQPILTDKPPPIFEKSQPPPQSIPSNAEEFTKNIAQLLQNENVMQILQAQIKNNQSSQSMQVQNQQSQQQQQNQPFQQNFNRMPPMIQMREPPPKSFIPKNQANFSLVDCPIFKSTKVVDYNHVHKQTFEESLMEFKVFRTIDYNHMTSYKLNEFIKEIDIDKVIEKRKAIALRKKILEYLRSAERPEDTVSNPKYPRNWQVEERERPPRKSKRRKRLTAKIKRILMEKCRDNSWMTKGYVRDENEQMDLETISSDDDDGSDIGSYEKPAKIARIEVDEKEEVYDEFRDIFKTIPDFNRFKHPRTISIKSLLWLPERKFRPHKILIILRGAAGSGKSHLVQLIKRKETEIGNSDIRILSIDDYYLTEEDEDCDPKTRQKLTQNYLENLQKHLKKTISNNLHNFIIIDAENCDLSSYNQFHQIGTSMGFSVYTIELYQMLDICMKQCKRAASKDEISKSIELLNKNRIPNDHMLLLPTALYEEYKCFVNPLLSNEKPKEVIEKPKEVEQQDDSIKNYQNYLVQTIDDDYLEVMPQFNWHNRETIDIRDILEEPGRFKRNKNIAILMRGPGGSGKNELASVILNKERENGNENCIFISIEEYFINEGTKKYEFNSRDLDTNIQKLIRKLLESMRSKLYNFIIVDVETGDFSHYMQIYELLSKQNQCYTIETYQDPAVCLENDIHKRSKELIDSVLEEMSLNPTPDDHILLDAAVFYKHPSTVASSDRPLKSALKTSPNTSFNAENLHSQDLEKLYESNSANSTLHEKFQARFNQRININGSFIDRNSSPPANLPEFNWFNENITDIREILEEPGRNSRPEKIAIFIRGAPCSGKTYLAALILRKEFEKGSEKDFNLLSIDEYFEEVKFRDTEFEGQYEKYIESNADAANIDEYMQELDENFGSILENDGPAFVVLDADFCDLKYYNEMWQKAVSSGFTCYTIELNQDDNTCKKFNDHKWNESFILERNKMMREIQTPKDHTLLDPEYLYQEYKYEFNENGDVFDENYEMEVDDEGSNDENNELSFGKFKMSAQTSKWDDYETPDIERLDGIKSKSKCVTMADYLQTDDANEWSMRPSQSGKKRVRWADIEEKKAQEHMRKIGFIVGHTDWTRMTDESDGKSALEKTKFIEPRQKK
ncbi:unnamed protein product [Chironomus riparius]|uniref:YLPM1-like spectrin repeat domain-containing protein n=1 Tax=Chironomus riparius TaxID=315576 RepID=A0A9N9RY95_9DIPT|nr:unnamed protein product [Chironomus riparius]